MPVYGSPILVKGSRQPQVLILGTSNTVLGLRIPELQALLGDVPVHSIAMGGQRFRSFDQLVELLYRQTPPEQQRNYIFVIGLSYPLISDFQARWEGKTSVDEELLRFGVFKDTSQGIMPRVAESHISTALELTWPFLIPKALYNFVIRSLLPERFWLGLVDPVNISDEDSNTVITTEKQNKARIDYYNNQVIDSDGKYTFKQLMQTAERIRTAGGQLVIIDLPSATWLQNATPIYSIYQSAKKPYITRLEKIENIHYVDLQNGFSDNDFYDGIHPRARITKKLAKLAVPTIQQAITELNTYGKK